MPTEPPVPLLFGFRGIRLLQVMLAVGAGALAIGGVLMLNSYIDEGGWPRLATAALLAALFLWLFGMAIRLPTSFVAISPERMRIRFGGFADQTFEVRDVLGAELVNWPIWKGLGVRTSFGGDVSLVPAPGAAAKLHLRHPLRVWLIPRLWRVRATTVVLSVRNPHRMVERFGPVSATANRATTPRPKPRRKGATR